MFDPRNELPEQPRRVHPLVQLISKLYLVPKREWQRRRVHRTVVELVLGHPLVVPPEVFNPVLFRTGRYFCEYIASSDLCKPTSFARGVESAALDCTTGTGAQAIELARRGFQVTAVDVNPYAVRAARANVALNDVESQISVLEGDLFGPVAGTRFELVVSALPLFRGRPTEPFDVSWRSSDIIERFAEGLEGVLAPDGLCLALFTSDGDQPGFFGALSANDLSVQAVTERHFGNEIVSIYCIRPRRPEKG